MEIREKLKAGGLENRNIIPGLEFFLKTNLLKSESPKNSKEGGEREFVIEESKSTNNYHGNEKPYSDEEQQTDI